MADWKGEEIRELRAELLWRCDFWEGMAHHLRRLLRRARRIMCAAWLVAVAEAIYIAWRLR